MPGRLFIDAPLADAAREAGVPAPPAAEPRLDISPGEPLWTLTVDGFREMRWGLIPSGRTNARGRPVLETLINARSETVFDKSAFAGLKRAVVPINGWYEWTGPPRRKTRWALRDRDGGWLWCAAVWDEWQAPGGTRVAQLATLTCAPNAEVAPIHDRMGVMLSAEAIRTWLRGDEPEARALCTPLPDGRVAVSETPAPDTARG
ncbi:Putative SOS response-associated peptidase YedK [Roseivivax jejudonensis]|uniref:Abasic site processing protein n=1 Tax=Roseivivax jejudonensis TaxID=1529041 RepID=A0A1X6ZIV1_9RHOB|nr:SOS response-associated peptidase family protein [Roseivivax jejudonensis]SLN52650.1 Putative SOS response-associated peptidase YedK [Roseivivax jejudonensis]